jgi:hypothetical protein
LSQKGRRGISDILPYILLNWVSYEEYYRCEQVVRLSQYVWGISAINTLRHPWKKGRDDIFFSVPDRLYGRLDTGNKYVITIKFTIHTVVKLLCCRTKLVEPPSVYVFTRGLSKKKVIMVVAALEASEHTSRSGFFFKVYLLCALWRATTSRTGQ